MHIEAIRLVNNEKGGKFYSWSNICEWILFTSAYFLYLRPVYSRDTCHSRLGWAHDVFNRLEDAKDVSYFTGGLDVRWEGWFIDIQSNRWMLLRLHLKRHRITAPLLLGHHGEVDFIIDHLCSHHNHHQILIMCHTQSLYATTDRSVGNKLPSL